EALKPIRATVHSASATSGAIFVVGLRSTGCLNRERACPSLAQADRDRRARTQWCIAAKTALLEVKEGKCFVSQRRLCCCSSLVSSRRLQQGSGFITRAPEFRADSGRQAQSVRASARSSQKNRGLGVRRL